MSCCVLSFESLLVCCCVLSHKFAVGQQDGGDVHIPSISNANKALLGSISGSSSAVWFQSHETLSDQLDASFEAP